MTLRKRLALIYSGALTLIVVILSLMVIVASRLTIYGAIDQLLNQSADELIGAISVVPIGEFGPLRADIVFHSDKMFTAPGISVQVWQTSDGMRSIPPRLVRASNDMTAHESPIHHGSLVSNVPQAVTTNINDTPARVAIRPYYSIGGVQIGVVQVATTVQAVEQTNNALLLIMGFGAVVSIGIGVGISLWLSNRVLKPIEHITRAAASIADAEDLSTRLAWRGAMDELGRLVDVFNHMMERLETLFRVQQRFVGDVSHELRTPLTSIIGNLEIVERYGYDQSSLDAVSREANRMSRMVNDLLLLARADNGDLQVDLYALDLDPIVLEVFEQAHILARPHQLQIKLGTLEPSRIYGNSDRLKQLLLNLVNNAIKFTADGGSITLSLTHEGDYAVLSVADTGIGIAPEDKKRIFDRFFQADHSRVQHSEMDGAGLGLSIVRWITETHNGRIDVDSTIGEGSTFSISLPLLKDENSRPPTQPRREKRTFEV